MEKFLLIGFGIVGQTIYNNIKDATVFDIIDPKFIKHGISKELVLDEKTINNYQAVFICVPTSHGEDVSSQYDNTILLNYLEQLKVHNYTGYIIIKSTVLPTDIEIFNDSLKIIYWAEFLSELTANEDFLKDTTPLFGGESVYKFDITALISDHFEHIQNINYIALSDALYFKYIRNTYISWKITYWNIIANADIMDHRLIQTLLNDYPLNDEMTKLSIDGKPGFGGKCLPKDFTAFNSVLQNQLFEKVLKFNKNLRLGEE
jgi:UDP-glucose 6-dehydrogenase